MGKPPPRPPGVARKLSSAELRLGNLRRELDAETDPAIRAAILYHMGLVHEHELRQPAEALIHYRESRRHGTGFDPAGTAELRIQERQADPKTVVALLEDLARESRHPATRAAALVDLALRSDAWAPLLREALEHAPEPCVPALLLEWLADSHQDRDALRDALRAQAEAAVEPALRASLWLDLALAESDAGNTDAALTALELSAECSALAWPARSLQRQLAEEHERLDVWEHASVAMAKQLEGDVPLDPLDLSVPMEDQLPLAAWLWREAAWVRLARNGDTDKAMEYLDAAVRLTPDDAELRWQSLELAERRGDAESTRAAATWLERNAEDDPRLAARAIRDSLLRWNDPTSLDTLRELAARHPDSVYAQAAYDHVLSMSGTIDEQVHRLRARAEALEGEARALVLWRAARLLAEDDAPEAAQSMFSESAAYATESSVHILRDALRVAVEAGHAEAIVARAQALEAVGLDDDDDHAVATYCRYAVRRSRDEDETSLVVLRNALHDPRNWSWAPHVARARAAAAGLPSLLAEAHEALSELAKDETKVDHLLAAMAAYATNQQWSDAERTGRVALEHQPDDPRVVQALEDVLRAAGRPEAVVQLARELARRDDDVIRGERSLLKAGVAAERDGDLGAAREAYQQALDRLPGSASAALSIAELSQRRDDAGSLLQAFDTLSCIELGGGASELFALHKADMLRMLEADSSEAGRQYERALEHPLTTLPSAAALLSLPVARTSDEQRVSATEILADAGVAFDADQNGFGVAFSAIRAALGREGSTAGLAWVELARLAPNDAVRAGTLLHGLREVRLARGEDAIDDLFILAQESGELSAHHPEAAVAIEEVLAPGDDPELRVAALERKLQHSTAIGRSAVEAACCRALVEADRGREAVVRITEELDERPDDLALWETLRNAARQAGEWALVAQSCERLAPFLDGGLRADLLEEAGAVRLDHLNQQQAAEDLFRAALEADPSRGVAFRRLHELLADREDGEALDALIASRLSQGGAEDRPSLLYERARLLRGFSDRPGALETLDELFIAEPEHSGALALAAEVHVSLEQWEQAVDCLRRLSKADVPDEQRRLAHLGAADFLENRLGRLDEALTELRAIEACGLADIESRLRVGALEEGFGNVDAAIDAYRAVLLEAPTHALAAERLASLMTGEERLMTLAAHEAALWSRVEAGELDAALLEALRKTAHWQGSLERSSALAAAEDALEPGASFESSRTDLGHVSTAAFWDPAVDERIEAVLGAAGSSLSDSRPRAKKRLDDSVAVRELERVSERFGARIGSVGASDAVDRVSAFVDRDGSLHWVVPTSSREGLGPADLFSAGRLAWAAPRGGAALLDSSPQRAAGLLAGVVLAARCRLSPGGPTLPAVPVKLRRTARKAVQAILEDTVVSPNVLLAEAKRVQRTADRAGLVASGDIGAAWAVMVGGPPTMTALRTSPRLLDLLRFWAAPDSPLWGNDG